MLFTKEAEAVAKSTGWRQGQRRLRGARFVQSLVVGWLAKPEERLSGLAQTTAPVGTGIKRQSLEQGFNEKSVTFMRELLRSAMQHVIQAEELDVELFKPFSAVRIADRSHLEVPSEFAEQYPSCGNQHGNSAGLKLQANLELVGGAVHCELQAGRDSDHTSEVAFHCAQGELSVREVGYFGVNHFEHIQHQGAYFLSRVPADHR